MPKNVANLFLIGPPKSATTSIWGYLDQHPEIFMCSPKEPNYFVIRSRADHVLEKGVHTETMEDYIHLFKGAEGYRYKGDASACYIYFPDVATAIKDTSPEAKVIAVLRNPVERAWSFYLYCWHFNNEDLDRKQHRFRHAFLQEEKEISEGRLAVGWLRAMGLYAQKIESYQKLFGDSLLVLLYDDFVENTEEATKTIFDFLGVYRDGLQIDYSRRNQTLCPKNRFLPAFRDPG